MGTTEGGEMEETPDMMMNMLTTQIAIMTEGKIAGGATWIQIPCP
jgi:hypothetical protein